MGSLLVELSIGVRFTARLLDRHGQPISERRGHNMMMANGLTAIAESLMWSGVEDVADSAGISGPIYLAPLWGAIGSGTQTPVQTLTALRTETTRAQVSSAAYSAASGSGSASVTYLFYYPGPSTAWTITEAGLFSSASATAGSGTMLDYWQFSPSLVVQTPNSLVLQATATIGGS